MPVPTGCRCRTNASAISCVAWSCITVHRIRRACYCRTSRPVIRSFTYRARSTTGSRRYINSPCITLAFLCNRNGWVRVACHVRTALNRNALSTISRRSITSWTPDTGVIGPNINGTLRTHASSACIARNRIYRRITFRAG